VTPADIERKLNSNLLYIAPEDVEVRQGKVIGAIRQIERIHDKAVLTEAAQEAVEVLERLYKMVPDYKG
jgi:hypothetical protein